ncbi:MAG: hypothetical protein KF819_04155 [Labilithrix sp.]|nr:hypothetical protein [Labilithrix sp.]
MGALRGFIACSLAAAIALELAGCSFFTSLDGLREPAAIDDDASSTADDASTPPVVGGGDAGAPEAGDGSVGAPPCATLSPAPFLCRDFDDGAPIAAGFDGVTTENGGALTIDADDRRSAPNSLLLVLPSAPSSQVVRAYLGKQLPDAVVRISVRMNVRIERRGGIDKHDIIGFRKSDSRDTTLVVRTNGSLEVEEAVPTNPVPGLRTPLSFVAPDDWWSLEWEVAISGAVATSTVRANGVEVGTATTSSETFSGGTFLLGDYQTLGLSSEWRTRYDDVVVLVE